MGEHGVTLDLRADAHSTEKPEVLSNRPSFCSSHHTYSLFLYPSSNFIMSSDEVYDGAIGIDLGMSILKKLGARPHM